MNKKIVSVIFVISTLVAINLHCMVPRLKEAVILQNFDDIKTYLETERLDRQQLNELIVVAHDQKICSEQRLRQWDARRLSNLVLSVGRIAIAMWGFGSLLTQQETYEGTAAAMLLATQSAILVVDGFKKISHVISNTTNEHQYAMAVTIQKLIQEYRPPVAAPRIDL